MKLASLLLALLAPSPVLAQSVSGPAFAIDGDTLDLTGTRVRLYGIDAVESAQLCSRGGAEWACGAEARRVLAALIQDKPVSCDQRDVDVYGRVVAVCRAGRLDLAEVMVNGGLAIAHGDDYAASEARAKAASAGIWAGDFVRPADYRAAHPQEFKDPVLAVAATGPQRARSAPQRAAASAAYYPNCATARAAGAAPLYRGQPGYRTALDRDLDGTACEPIPRGRGR